MSGTVITGRGTNQLENEKFREDNNGDTAVAVIVCAGTGGHGFVPGGPIVVSASSTEVIDTTLLSTFSRLDYIINFKDNPITVTKSLKLVVQNDAGSLTDKVSERMGGNIDVDVDVTDDAVDASIEITNNESFDVTVTFLKALTP
jgi:hypothetical protein